MAAPPIARLRPLKIFITSVLFKPNEGEFSINLLRWRSESNRHLDTGASLIIGYATSGKEFLYLHELIKRKSTFIIQHTDLLAQVPPLDPRNRMRWNNIVVFWLCFFCFHILSIPPPTPTCQTNKLWISGIFGAKKKPLTRVNKRLK